MKLSQVLKLATVVMALGVVPFHTVFANESERSSEVASAADHTTDQKGSDNTAEVTG